MCKKTATAGIQSLNGAGKISIPAPSLAGARLGRMNTQMLKQVTARFLLPLGIIGMVVGAADPLEGSVLILGGSGLVALSTWLGRQGRTVAVYRTWLFGMIAFGVLAMFVLSNMGGVGGKSGRSMWWLLVLLPYPIGWLLAMANLVSRGIERLRHRHVA